MSKPIVIRRATLDDTARPLALQKVSFGVLAAGCYNADAIKAYVDHSGLALSDALSRGHCFVAECGGVLVACGAWSSRASGHASLVANGRCPPPHATVNALYVDPAWVRLGFGRRIMTAIEADMIANGHWHADLTATLNATAFYRSMCYAGSTSVDLLRDGVSVRGVHMSKDLRTSQPALRRMTSQDR